MAGGQISQLIRLLDKLPAEQADMLMKRLLKEQPLVALRIAQKHFSFDDLRFADDSGLASLIEKAGEDQVITALTAADDNLIRRFADQFGTGRAHTFIADVDASAEALSPWTVRVESCRKAMMLRKGVLSLIARGLIESSIP